MCEIPEGYFLLPRREAGNCFGCGSSNAAGLHMKFFSNGSRVVSLLSVPHHLCGWGNLVHGGISCTIVDEIMGWTAICQLKRIVLTKSISVTYKKPVFAEENIRVEGYVAEKVNDREALLSADIYNQAGELCVCANGKFALYTLEGAKQLGFVDEKIMKEFVEISTCWLE